MQRPFNGDNDEDLLDRLEIPASEHDYKEKEKYVKESIGDKLRKFRGGVRLVKHVLALFRYMTDRDIPWFKKSLVAAALAYFIIPVDSIPDMIPVIGYLDDFGVIAAVLAYLGKEIQPYYYPSPAMGSQDEDRPSGDYAG